MNMLDVILFENFRVLLDGREIPLTPCVKEVLALLAVADGHRVTAKGLWAVLYSYRGIKYNSFFYTERVSEMKSELEFFHIPELIYCSSSVLRSCRMNLDKVRCDYYEMLDGAAPLGRREDFLPEYGWSDKFYHEDRSALYRYWESLKI